MTSHHNAQKRGKPRRGRQAFALVTITIIGFFAIAMMMALFPLILNAIRNESTNRSISELRDAAEIGIDYATKSLNDAITNGTISSIEPLSGSPYKVTAVPSILFPNLPGVTVNVKVRRLTPLEYSDFQTYSSLYSPQLDPSNNSTAGKTYSSSLKTTTVSNDYWRIIECTASRGPFSRSIRAILEPRFEAPPFGTTTGPNDSSFFKNSFFGGSGISTSPPAGTPLTISAQSQTANLSSYDLNLTSNVRADIGSNTDIFGNVKVSNITTGATQYASGTGPGPTSDLSDPSIHGRLITNSGTTGYSDSQSPLPSGTDTVRADAELNPTVNPSTNPTQTRTGVNQSQPMDSGNGNAGSAITVAPVILDSTASNLPDLTALSTQGSSLPAGSYKTASFQADATNLTQSLSTSGQVRVFVEDGSFAGDAVSISSSLFNSPSNATDLQIFYSGNRPINITLDNRPFNGVVYAPNSRISISGKGDFNGAIVGDKVSLSNNGTVTIRNDLQDPATAKTYNLSYKSMNNPGNPDEPPIQGYKTVTWQETTRRLVE